MKTNWVSNLKEVRNSKNLSLDACSKAINIPIDFLSNLESGSFKKLPPAVFTKFHIKRYFDYLNLDPSACLSEYEEFISNQEKRNRKKDLKIKEKKADKNRSLYKIYLGIIIVIISLAVTLYLFLNDSQKLEETLPDETDIFLDENDDLKETDPNLFEEIINDASEVLDEVSLQEDITLIEIPLKINLEIKGESWIVLEDKNERMLYELMQTGSYELRGSPPFKFKVGYAPAVEIFIDGNKINFNNFINKTSKYAAFYTINGKDVEKIRN